MGILGILELIPHLAGEMLEEEGSLLTCLELGHTGQLLGTLELGADNAILFRGLLLGSLSLFLFIKIKISWLHLIVSVEVRLLLGSTWTDCSQLTGAGVLERLAGRASAVGLPMGAAHWAAILAGGEAG